MEGRHPITLLKSPNFWICVRYQQYRTTLGTHLSTATPGVEMLVRLQYCSQEELTVQAVITSGRTAPHLATIAANGEVIDELKPKTL